MSADLHADGDACTGPTCLNPEHGWDVYGEPTRWGEHFDDETLANAIYVAVALPDTIWWDDLTSEMKDAWLRGARAARRHAPEPPSHFAPLVDAVEELEHIDRDGLLRDGVSTSPDWHDNLRRYRLLADELTARSRGT